MKKVKREYHKNGKLKRLVCVYDNGKLNFETPFVDGKLHGVKRHWYKSGQLLSEIPYENGKLHGIQRYWQYDGELRLKVFENDIEIEDHGLIVWDMEIIL